MKKLNIKELIIRNRGGKLYDIENVMLEILENNIDGLETLEEVKEYIRDAYPINGSVSGLIYYYETKLIFEKHFEDILEILEDYKTEVGTIDDIELNFNNLVWFVWEYFRMEWENILEDIEIEEDDEE